VQAGELVLEAATLRLDGELIEATDVRFTRCTCAEPPWFLELETLTLDGEEAVHGPGWFRLCGRRVLAIPAGSFRLDGRKAGFGVPLIGVADELPSVSLPWHVPVGKRGQATISPGWRGARGPRLGVALDTTHLALDGQAGADMVEGRFRGFVQVDHAWAAPEGRTRTGADALLWTDATLLADEGLGLLDRRRPFAESRGLLAHGPAWITAQRFSGEDVGLHQVEGHLGLHGRNIGPVAWHAGSQVRMDDTGQEASQLAWAGAETGIVRPGVEAHVQALAWGGGALGGELDGEAHVRAGVHLPTWAKAQMGLGSKWARTQISGDNPVPSPELTKEYWLSLRKTNMFNEHINKNIEKTYVSMQTAWHQGPKA
jgi:hypothetical protein